MPDLNIQAKINEYVQSHPEFRLSTEDVILSVMLEEGVITQAEIDALKKTNVWSFGNGVQNSNFGMGLTVERSQADDPPPVRVPFAPKRKETVSEKLDIKNPNFIRNVNEYAETQYYNAALKKYAEENDISIKNSELYKYSLKIKFNGKSMPLEEFLTDYLLLDLTSEIGSKIYSRLLSQGSEILTSVDMGQVDKLVFRVSGSTNDFDSVADAFEDVGIGLRTQEEFKATQAKREKVYYRHQAVAIMAYIYEIARQMNQQYDDSLGWLDMGKYRELLCRIDGSSAYNNAKIAEKNYQGVIKLDDDALYEEEFARNFKAWTGIDYNENSIKQFLLFMASAGDNFAGMLNAPEVRNKIAATFGSRLASWAKTADYVEDRRLQDGVVDTAFMVATMGIGAELKSAQIGLKSGQMMYNAGKFGKFAFSISNNAAARAVLYGGANFGVYSATKTAVNYATRKQETHLADYVDVVKAFNDSFLFGAAAAEFGALVAGPLSRTVMQKVGGKLLNQSKPVIEALEGKFASNGTVTLGDIVNTTLENGPNIIAKVAGEATGLVTEIVGFSAYEISMQAMNGQIPEGISFKEYLGEVLHSQFMTLGEIKAISWILMGKMANAKIPPKTRAMMGLDAVKDFKITQTPEGKFELRTKNGVNTYNTLTELQKGCFDIVNAQSPIQARLSKLKAGENITLDFGEEGKIKFTKTEDGKFKIELAEEKPEETTKTKPETKASEVKEQYTEPETEIVEVEISDEFLANELPSEIAKPISKKTLTKQEAIEELREVIKNTSAYDEAKIPGILEELVGHFINFLSGDVSGEIPIEAIELIKLIETKKVLGPERRNSDVLFNIYLIGRWLDIDDIKGLTNLINKFTESGKYEGSDITRLVDWSKVDASHLDFDIMTKLIEKGYSIDEIANMRSEYMEYSLEEKKYYTNASKLRRLLTIKEVFPNEDPTFVKAIMRIGEAIEPEQFQKLIENPETTKQFLNKLIELKLIGEMSFSKLDHMNIVYPITEMQIKVLNIIEKFRISSSEFSEVIDLINSINEYNIEGFETIIEQTQETSFYMLLDIKNVLKNVDENNSEYFKVYAKKLGVKYRDYHDANAYAHHLPLISKLDPQTRAMLIEMYEKDCFDKSISPIKMVKTFPKAYKEIPEIVSRIYERGIKADYTSIVEFFNGTEDGSWKKLTPEQIDFVFEIMEKEDGTFYSSIDRNNAIASMNTEVRKFVEALLKENMYGCVHTIESAVMAYEKDPDILIRFMKLKEDNPEIFEEIESNGLILDNFEKIEFLLSDKALTDGLKKCDNYGDNLFISIIKDSDITLEKLKEAKPYLRELSPETMAKIPQAIGVIFALNSLRGSGRVLESKLTEVIDLYVDSYNRLAKYDQETIDDILPIMYEGLCDSEVMPSAFNNFDYASKYIRKNGVDDYIKQVILMKADINQVLDYGKTLKLSTDEIKTIVIETAEVSQQMSNIETIKLNEKIELYNKLKDLDPNKKAFYKSLGLDIDGVISKLGAMIGAKRAVIKTPKMSQMKFLRQIMANNNTKSEQIIKTFDFAQYGKEGLPLKYSRAKFTQKVEQLLSELSPREQGELLVHFGLTKGAAGFDGLPNNVEFISENASPKMKRVASQIQHEIEKYTLYNEVQTGDAAIDEVLNGLIKGFPEFTFIVGKEQHGTHAYSVDIHTLKVLQSAMNHPLYKTLSDVDKTILKMSVLIHDFGKRGGVVDTGHAELSAEYCNAILDKFPFPPYMKDRILDIVENHHWFEAYNTGKATAADVATRCRRPEDFKIYQIFSKADFENVNPDFHLARSGVSSQAEFDQFMADKMAAIEERLGYLYRNANLVFDTKFVRKGELFPRTTVEINGEPAELKVLDFNTLQDGESLVRFGFGTGVTKNNFRAFVHMTDPKKTSLDAVLVLTQNSLNQSTWSSTLISASNNRTYSYRRFGFVLDIDQANIGQAYYENLGSGCKKSIQDFERIIFDATGETRTFVRDRFLAEMKSRGIELTEEEYGILAKDLFNKRFLTQVRISYEVGEKVIPAQDVVECMQKSADALFEGGDIHSEIIPINPRVQGLIAIVDDISECPEEFLQFAQEHDLPIILMKQQHE